MKRVIGLVISVLWLVASVSVTQAGSATPVRLIPAKEKAIPNQYIVVLKEGADARSVAAMAGVSPKYVYAAALNGFAADLNAGQLTALQHNPHVDYIEQDGEVSINVSQSVSYGQWGLDRIDQRTLPLNGFYNYTATGSGINAYIISSGIAITHPDFGGRATNVYDVWGGTGNDCHGSGTGVAGLVGGVAYGVAKAVRLRGVRVLDCNGTGTWSGVIAGIDWVRMNAVKPAVATINVTGTGISLNTAATSLANSGVFFAVPAGDTNANACNYAPAGAASVFTVAATDRTDTRLSISNYGSCVELYAPGASLQSINTTVHGTAAAAALTAGCAAKIQSLYPGTDPGSWMITNATPDVVKGNPVGTHNRLLYCPV